MIARENMEKRRDTLVARSGILALEQIDHETRVRTIREEMRQIGVLLKVFEATLVDMKADDKETEDLRNRVAVLEARFAEQEGTNAKDGGSEST
jgi:hypothetical protein